MVVKRFMLDWVSSLRAACHLKVKGKDGRNSPRLVSSNNRLVVNLSVMLVVSNVKSMHNKCRSKGRNIKPKNSEIIRNITK